MLWSDLLLEPDSWFVSTIHATYLATSTLQMGQMFVYITYMDCLGVVEGYLVLALLKMSKDTKSAPRPEARKDVSTQDLKQNLMDFRGNR